MVSFCFAFFVFTSSDSIESGLMFVLFFIDRQFYSYQWEEETTVLILLMRNWIARITSMGVNYLESICMRLLLLSEGTGRKGRKGRLLGGWLVLEIWWWCRLFGVW